MLGKSEKKEKPVAYEGVLLKKNGLSGPHSE